MDAKIEDFNWNLRYLLDVLSSYQANVNQANPTTLQLLEETLDRIGNLIENVDEVNNDSNNDKIIFSIDNTLFNVTRTIFCRICKVNFDASRSEYLLHLANAEHNRKLIDHLNRNNESNEIIILPQHADKNTNRNVSPAIEKMVKTKYTFDNSSNVQKLSAEMDGNIISNNDQKQDSPKSDHIPNVFEDNIFHFLDSMEKQKNITSHEQNNSNKGLSKDVPSATISWRVSSNGNTVATKTDSTKPTIAVNDRTSLNNPTKPKPLTQSIIQNGAVLTGAGLKPCPTYELNNLYNKFPYLNPNKVPNPLKPIPLQDVNLSPGKNIERKLQNTNLKGTGRKCDDKPFSNGGRVEGMNKSFSRDNPNSSTSQNKISSKNTPIKGNAQAVNGKNTGTIPKQPVNSIQSKKNGNDFDVTTLIETAQLEKFFSCDITSLINFITTSNSRPDKFIAQRKLIDSIESIMKEKFGTVKCYLIGSHAYSIAKGGLAPIDFYLDLCDSFHKDKSGQIIVTAMNRAMQLLEKSADWTTVKCSEQTRYGILSGSHKLNNEKIECRFAFGTGVTVRNSEIINILFAAQPVARQLVICIRLALQEGAKNEWAKHFTGYIVSLLVIFHFQSQGFLPTIASLQSDPNLQIVQCGENLVHFNNPTNITICKSRLRDLMIGFFEFYEDFDFTNNIISPFEGLVIGQKVMNCERNILSRSMQRFLNLVESEPKRWTKDRMCIQDIFEHKRNASQMIRTNEMKAFKEFCKISLNIIRNVGSSVKY